MNKHLIRNRSPKSEPYSTIIDEVSEQDRVWFEAHPDRIGYLRPSVPGELGPPMDHYAGKLTLVTQLQPGIRHRQIIPSALPVRTS